MEVNPTPMGRIGCLPPELRFMIWDHFYPQGAGRNKTDFTILRSSSTIFNEIMYYFKWPYSLGHFEVDIHTYQDYECSIRIYNRDRSVCWKVPAKWFSGLPGLKGFEYWPVNQLDVIVNISAPRGIDDPGEILLIWERCTILRNLLNFARTKTVRCLVLRLGDNELWTWIRRPSATQPDFTTPVNSLPAYMNPSLHPDGGDDFSLDDLRMSISPFFTAARVANTEVYMGETSLNFSEASGYLTVLRERMHTDLDKIRQPAELKVVNFHVRSCLHALLMQTALDEADGPTSHYMRLERFIDWCDDPKSYQTTTLAMLYICKDEIRRSHLTHVINTGVWARWGMMRLADPGFCSGTFPILMHTTHPREQRHLLSKLVHEFLHGERSSPENWRRAYPAGIAAFSDHWWVQRKYWLGRLDYEFVQHTGLLKGTFLGALLGVRI